MKKWNLENISKYRGEILGLATIFVMYFHSFKLNFISLFGDNLIFHILNFTRKTGNIGVDIFLILSGIGLYYSFNKNSNIKEFYKKRLNRVLPPSLIVAIIYLLYKSVNIKNFILGVTFTQFYIDGNRYFWYISFILVMYLLYPLIHNIIKKYDNKALFIIPLIIGISTLLIYLIPNIYKNIEIALTRIPVFIFGVYLGKKIVDKREISIINIPIAVICFIIINYLLYNVSFPHYSFVRYLYGMLACIIVLLTSYILSIIRTGKLNNLLIFIGTYSLEIYLIYEKLGVELYKTKLSNINVILFYLIISVVSILISMLLKWVLNFTKKK